MRDHAIARILAFVCVNSTKLLKSCSTVYFDLQEEEGRNGVKYYLVNENGKDLSAMSEFTRCIR